MSTMIRHPVGRLLRIHGAGIGWTKARFDPITIDLWKPDADGRRIGTDTVLWAENGTCKSTLLALLFAVFRPHGNEFMLRKDKREFVDYLLENRIGHLITEWSVDEDGINHMLQTPRTRLIGVLMYQTSEAAPQRVFWTCLTGDNLRWADLPVRGIAASHANTAAEFRSWLAQQKAQPQNEVTFTDQQQVWLDLLENEVGCDTELLRYQRDMNSIGEGGIASFFKEKVRDPRTFTQFLCGVIVPPESDEATAKAVDNLRTEHRNRPHLDLEVAFFENIEAQLQVLSDAGSEYDRAAEAQTETRTLLGRTLQLVVQYQVIHKRRMDDLRTQAKELKSDAGKADEGSKSEHVLGMRWRQTELRICCSVANQELEKQRGDVKTATAWCAVFSAAAIRSEIVAGEAMIRWLGEQRLAAQHDLAPFIQAHADAAVMLRHALRREIIPWKTQLEETTKHVVAAESELKKLRRESEELGRQRREQARICTQMEEKLEQRQKGIDWLVAKQMLPQAANPLTFRAELLKEIGKNNETQKRLVAQVESARGKAVDASRLVDVTVKQIEQAHRTMDDASKRQAQHEQAKNDLQIHPGWKELNEGVDDPDITGISERVTSAIGRNNDALGAHERRRARDVDAVQALDQTGLLPVSPGTEAVLAFLGERGIQTMPASKSLADQVPDLTQLRALIAANPARTSGVVVNTLMDLDRVRRVFDKDKPDLREGVVIGLPRHTPPVDPISTSDCVVIPPSDLAACNYDAARQCRQVIARREETAGRELADLQQRQQHLSGLLEAMGGYLKSHGPQVRAKVEEERRLAKGNIERLDLLHASQSTSARQLSIDAEKLADDLHQLNDRCGKIVLQERSVGQHCDQHEAHAAKNRDALVHAKAEEERLALDRQANEKLWQEVRDEQKLNEERLVGAGLALSDFQGECSRIKSLPSDWEARSAKECGLKEARQIESAAYQTLQANDRTASLVAQCDALEGELGTKRSAFAKAIQAVPQALHQDVETTSAIADRELRADEAMRTRNELLTGEGAADQRLKTANAAMTEWVRKNPGLVDMPAVIDAQVAASAAERAFQSASDLSAQHKSLLEQAEKDEVTAKRIEHDLEGLRRDSRRIERLHQSELMGSEISEEDIPELPTLRAEIDRVEELDRTTREAGDLARDNLTKQFGILQAITAKREFSVLDDNLKRPYVGDMVEIAHDAGQRLVDIHQHLASARSQRDSFASCVQIAAKRLQTLLEQVLAGLQTLNRVARISASKVPVLEGRPIINLQNFPTHLTTADGARIAEQVLRSLLDDQGVIPGVALLACKLLEAAVHEGGGWDRIRISTVKIENDGKAVTVPLAEVVKESGGEAIVAGALIYMALYRMRQETKITGRGTGQQGGRLGVLILDNPFGSCSRIDFIDVQKTIAEQMGLQLIFTCGTNDEQAVSRLGHVVRLRARPEARGGSYVDAVNLGWHGRPSPAIATAAGI